MSTPNVSPSLVLADHIAPGGRPLAPIGANPTLSDIIARRSSIIAMVRAHDQDTPGGRCLVIPADPSRPARTVVNLGWLMRHRGGVRHPLVGLAFSVETERYKPRTRPDGVGIGWALAQGPIPVETFPPILLAHLEDGRTYAASFADPTALHGFLDRPSWRGYLVDWNTPLMSTSLDTCAIGGDYYRQAIPAAIAQYRANVRREAYYRAHPSAPWGSHDPEHPDHVKTDQASTAS